MGDALLSGVSGLKAHQKMLDVAGNNLANMNTTAFKSSRVSFAETLSTTLRNASQPTATKGGTNPMQVGSGVSVASVDRDMAQGSLVSTGQPLDMAIEGAGFFVLNDGQKDVYTRAGSFAVDSNYYLVDPSTGNRVQRTGSEGVADGFQSASNNAIRIPYDVALPAKETTAITFSGNLSADESNATTNSLTSATQLLLSTGAVVSETTKLSDVAGASLAAGDKFIIQGIKRDGTYVGGAAAGTTYTYAANDTVNTLLSAISNAFPGSTATLVNGEIRLTDNATGYSQTELKLSYTAGAGNGTGKFPLPNYFSYLSVGGQDTKNVNVEIYDAQGIGHVVSAMFTRRSTTNTWDMVVTSVTGDVTLTDRRINGIKFLADGSYGGISSVTGPDGNAATDTATLKLVYGNDPTNTVSISTDLGIVGGFNGLSQFGGTSTVAPNSQDGYASGWLSSLSVTNGGVLMGVFTNGVRRDLAAIKLATFQNPAGLESIGNNYFQPSTNSGEPVPTKANASGAGSIQGGSLEKSNVDTAAEFVNLIQAQNGYQANARTIKVTNDMLSELTNLIR